MQAARCARDLTALTALIFAMAPSLARAQAAASPTIDPASLRLFLDMPPPSTLWAPPPERAVFWNPPPTGSQLPQWTVEWKGLLNGPRGSTFSAGFIGGRNPLPLYSPAATVPNAARTSMSGPAAYREQLYVTLGVESPPLTIGKTKVTAFGEVILPVSPYCSKDPASAMLKSPVLRAGIKSVF